MKIVIPFLFIILLSAVRSECSAQRIAKDYLLMSCVSDGMCGYINKAGVMVVPPGKYYTLYTDTFRNIALVGAKGRGVIGINRRGKVLYQVHIFDNGPDDPIEGVYRIKIKDKFGFADEKGIVIRPRFDFVYPFHDGYAVFVMGCTFEPDCCEHILVQGGKCGYIDRKGRIVQPAIYDSAQDFDENGIATVTYNGRPMKISEDFIEIVGK